MREFFSWFAVFINILLFILFVLGEIRGLSILAKFKSLSKNKNVLFQSERSLSLLKSTHIICGFIYLGDIWFNISQSGFIGGLETLNNSYYLIFVVFSCMYSITAFSDFNYLFLDDFMFRITTKKEKSYAEFSKVEFYDSAKFPDCKRVRFLTKDLKSKNFNILVKKTKIDNLKDILSSKEIAFE